nr:immunoglobulin light chain junction region [Macaca mulatta]
DYYCQSADGNYDLLF